MLAARLVMSPVSNQIAAVGQNNTASTNKFDMQLGAERYDSGNEMLNLNVARLATQNQWRARQ